MLPKEARCLLCELTITGEAPLPLVSAFARRVVCESRPMRRLANTCTLQPQLRCCYTKPQHAKDYRAFGDKRAIHLPPTCQESMPDATCLEHQGLGWPNLFLTRLSYLIPRPSMECENQGFRHRTKNKTAKIELGNTSATKRLDPFSPLMFMRAVAFRRSLLECAYLKLALPHSFQSFSKQRRRVPIDSADFT